MNAAPANNATTEDGTTPPSECVRNWWRREAERTGSDWQAILALHLWVLALCGLVQACEICDAAPCRSPQFCKACREADERKARSEQPRYIGDATHIPRDWDAMPMDALSERFQERRPTPQSTIEAILWSVRTRGLAALKEPASIERLERCDAAARAEINRRIQKLTPAEEIAT
jgi:hypothetical protein